MFKRIQINICYYEDKDLKLVFNIVFLNCNGIKIFKIVKMIYEEIVEKVGVIFEINFEYGI